MNELNNVNIAEVDLGPFYGLDVLEGEQAASGGSPVTLLSPLTTTTGTGADLTQVNAKIAEIETALANTLKTDYAFPIDPVLLFNNALV